MDNQWNAKDYFSDFKFVHQYGKDVLKLLDITAGDIVLDLGCGYGELTQELVSVGADAIGLDVSEEMLELARQRHPDIRFILGDAADFRLNEPVDAIFSNAVFHWISNQDSLLTCVSRNLKNGGQLVCEFGGHGCNTLIHSALQEAFALYGFHYHCPFYFPTIGEYAPRLEKHGLHVVFAALFDRPTELSGQNGMANWIKMFIKKPFEGIPERIASDIIQTTVHKLTPVLYKNQTWIADYVRLRLKAIKYS